MGAKCNKTNREIAWLLEIFAPAKVFFRFAEAVNATFQRHTLTGPGQFCEGCLFSVGVFQARPFFLTLRKRACYIKVFCSLHARFFLILFAGQDRSNAGVRLRAVQ